MFLASIIAQNSISVGAAFQTPAGRTHAAPLDFSSWNIEVLHLNEKKEKKREDETGKEEREGKEGKKKAVMEKETKFFSGYATGISLTNNH